MARIDICKFIIGRQDIPGDLDKGGGLQAKGFGLMPFEVRPSFPARILDFLHDSFSMMQMQLGTALDASRQYPYFRAVLAEEILCKLEKYFTENSVRSDALGNFLAMSLMNIAGRDRFMDDLVWKTLTVSIHYNEAQNDDSAPHTLPGTIQEVAPDFKAAKEATERLVEVVPVHSEYDVRNEADYEVGKIVLDEKTPESIERTEEGGNQ